VTMLSRRHFLAGSAAALSMAPFARALAADTKTLRIGVVLPSKTGGDFVRASVNDFIGDAARWGATLADNDLGRVAQAAGIRLDLLMSTSPTVEAAIRAGERLVETGNIDAMVGGVGEGQAQVLAEIATAAKVPFFNLGESDDALRQAGCSRYVFHMEASDAMYLDALAQLAKAQGYQRWYVVSDDTPRGQALAARAAVSAQKADAEIVGSLEVRAAQSIYYDDVDTVKEASADMILILLQAFDQFSFMLQMEDAGIVTPVLSFPHTITQTRDFIAAARFRLPTLNPRHRIALWETTDPDSERQAFNEKIRAQWGEGADPTAWAAYHAVKILLETVIATESTEADAIIGHLEAPETTFELLKGPGTGFRPWDHQLRQPLYGVSVDQDAVWERMNLDSRIGIAAYEGSYPAGAVDDADPVGWLDQLGDIGEGQCA